MSPGKCFLTLDIHASHCSASEILELIDSHRVTVVCLSSHIVQVFQLLDLSFPKHFKTQHKEEVIIWERKHRERDITPYQVGAINGKLAENIRLFHMAAHD
jgi:Icc-related predicted phosphoesterase